jgi:hypothetical protein
VTASNDKLRGSYAKYYSAEREAFDEIILLFEVRVILFLQIRKSSFLICASINQMAKFGMLDR